ncbi:MAG TPA: hypothetical protein VEG39_17450 [Clostridia bacterium]|nr:hypothetical protein [Clostridia bacterium]
MINSTTHQLSFKTKPLTVLLTPPNNSPTGSGGREKGTGAAVVFGTRAESRLLTGETAGAGAGGHGAAAGGNAV